MIQYRRVMVSAVALGILLSLWGTGLVSPSRAQEFQNVPILLRVSDVLPREILRAPITWSGRP